jgi:hypothetical protein
MSELTLRYRPPQRIPFSKKTEEWRKDNVKYWCDQADLLYYNEWQRMNENYLFHNNVFNQEEFQKYCDPLGLDAGRYTDYVQPFNRLPNKINTLMGEERKRPFNFHIKQLGSNATSEILREKEKDFRNYVNALLQREIEMQQLELQQALGQIQDADQYEQMAAEIEARFQKENEGVLDLNKIKNKYKNRKTTKEKLATTLLKSFIVKNKVKHKKNEAFFHACVAGVEALHIYNHNGKTYLEVVNPLGLAWHKSPEEQFMQNGDAVTYKREMTVGDVMDYYGDYLSKEDIDNIENFLSRVYGLDAKLYSKDGYSPSHYENTTKGYSRYGDGDVRHSGAYGQGTSDESFLTVYTTYWRSQRMVGFLTTINEYGKEQVEIVDEAYDVPKYAEKIKYTNEEGVDKIQYTWQDQITGQPFTLQWEWVPQIWQGTRIEDNIYVNINPLYGYSVSVHNPKEQKLPIIGVAYNNVNAPIVSIFDRGKHWQKLFLAVMHKWTKLIMQDQSVLNTLDTSLLSKEIPLDIALRYAFDVGLLPYNSLSNAEGAGILNNTRKIIESFNLSNPNLERYTNILLFLDNQISDAVGVTKQREGQMAQYSNATDNQQSIIQSSHITESVFALHDLLWEDTLNCAMKLIVANIDKYKGFMREILSDEEIALIDLGEMNEFDEFSIRVVDSNKLQEDINLLRANAQSLLQNDENALKYLIAIMGAEGMAELKEEIYAIQADIEARREAMQRMQGEQAQQIEQMRIEAREDEQEHEIMLKEMDIQGQLLKAEIDAFKFQKQLDSDNNQIPDHLELAKWKSKAETDNRKLDLQEKKMEQDKELKEKELAIKKTQKAKPNAK